MRHSAPSEGIAHPGDSENGLNSAEVEARRSQFGTNAILEATTAGWREVLGDSARDPMIWFLVGISVLFFALGDITEAIVLAVALVPILGMDAWLHRRTRASMEGLAGQLAVSCRVIRDGVICELPSEELVPGDLVVVGASESLPADGIIVAGSDLQVEASALTGESLPLRKAALTTISGDSIDDVSWGAAGTRLLTGELRLRVVHTGADTLYGQIVRLASAGPRDPTPMQAALRNLVSTLVVASIIMCVALAVARYHQGHGLLDALLSAVTLAVAALPEEFPVVFTAFLGVGVFRLARRKALVRRAVVVENIGRVTAICTDKTGTLTEGSLALVHLCPATGLAEQELLGIAAGASRADSSDPMDLAILSRGSAAEGARLATFPFNEQSRREVSVYDIPGKGRLAVCKGAPETVLAMSTLDETQRANWLAQAEQLAADGHKVLGCARLAISDWHGGEPDRDFTFAGLFAFEDPLRPGVKEAVTQARDAGIRVLMVTGDHPRTAVAIARELGMGDPEPRVISGDELALRLEREGVAAISGIDVVARCLPARKLDIVSALRSSGEIVAVTGDGVNDVPALQGADIGIAMGERGTRSAREVAPIVLLDDNFRTIVDAIAEGRQLFSNLQLSFAYLLMIHLPLVLTAAFIPWLGYPLLYLPIHVVWLELIIHPTALLVFQQLPAKGPLAPLDRSARPRFFNLRQWLVIGVTGGLLTVLVGAGYAYSLGPGQNVEHARTMALLSLIVASALVTAALSGLGTRSAWIAVAATLCSALVLIPLPSLAALLHLEPLHVDDWILATLGGCCVASVGLLFRPVRRRRQGPGGSYRPG
ncbi:cation-translocating P-type ATPase [Haliea sp. E17]|uniref:cation-translocating P-type ATPase n=1 Tax=Haliea sp. E17 TaxID=3401576 RepID=UPI003AB0CCB7